MSARRFDRALSLSAVAATAVVISSLLIHNAWVGDDRRHRQDGTTSLAELVGARLEGGLHNVLATVETAAMAPRENLGSLTATLRSHGTLVAVRRVTADGREPPLTLGDAASLAPVSEATLNAARDSGAGYLEHVRGRSGLLAVAPVYRRFPNGTAERREAFDGYVVASIDVAALLQDSRPPDLVTVLQLEDDHDPVATLGSPYDRHATRQGPSARLAVEAGGDAYVLTVSGVPPNTRFPVLPLTGAALGALIAGNGAAIIRRRRRAEATATGRDEELSLLANLGALLQGSLDLEIILPAAALRLSEHLQLDGFAVLRADRRGHLVRAFSLGTVPAERPIGVADMILPPEVVEAGEEALFPLQRAGRVTGALWLRPRRALDQASVRSVHAAADLMAAALANADAFDQERESVRRLEDLDRIKNRFIGTVSHEMRTSASAISGFASLLSSRWDRLDDEERRDLVIRIDRNGQSLVSVVEDFLDFSRLERRSPASDPPPASLSELVATAVDDLATLAPRHRILTRIAPDVGAFVDRAAVERILANLVSNAAKYSPDGSQITIRVEPAGDTALLSVDDEGSGIPGPEREKVFEAFYRAGHPAVAGTHGAGIGLAVVKEVADRLRARVSVEDSPFGGARLVTAFRAAPSPRSRSALLTGVPDDH